MGFLTSPTVEEFEFARWRTAAILKPLNCHIYATVLLILMKFGIVTHIAPLQRIVR